SFGERAQRMIEGAGSVPNAKDNRRFGFSTGWQIRRGRTGRSNQQKSSVVLHVILNRFGQHLPAIHGGSATRSNSGGIARSFIHHDLDSSGRVVYRHGLDLRMLAEKCLTLRKGDGMRERLSDVVQCDTGRRNQSKQDVSYRLSDDLHVVLE